MQPNKKRSDVTAICIGTRERDDVERINCCVAAQQQSRTLPIDHRSSPPHGQDFLLLPAQPIIPRRCSYVDSSSVETTPRSCNSAHGGHGIVEVHSCFLVGSLRGFACF